MNIFDILFLCEDKDIGRFSNLHLSTFNAQPLFIFIIVIVLLVLYYCNYYYYYSFISGSSNSSSSNSNTSSIIIIIFIISSSSINMFLVVLHQFTSPLFIRDYNGNKVTQLFCAIFAIAHFFYHGLNFNEFIFV